MQLVRVVLVAVVMLVAGGVASAADSAEAEDLIAKGVELRRQGRDERALPLFQKAYQLAPSPRTAGQLGFAEMAVGYWLDAEQHMTEALETLDHPWVAKNRGLLEQALTTVRSNIGEIAIDGPQVGATLSVNNHPAGTFPLSGPVRVGKG
jgi:tetratricopeptide (TPR) repeat protein